MSKNSRTSSKPPSSDIVKPADEPAQGGKKRKPGGQPGHAKLTRAPFAADQVQAAYEYDWATAATAAARGPDGGPADQDSRRRVLPVPGR